MNLLDDIPTPELHRAATFAFGAGRAHATVRHPAGRTISAPAGQIAREIRERGDHRPDNQARTAGRLHATRWDSGDGAILPSQAFVRSAGGRARKERT